jgi:hypothetical protein
VNPNSAPAEGLSASLAAERSEKAPGDVEATNGPQAGAQSFGRAEVHHWDAKKIAEAARILKAHPPRGIELICSTVDHPTA